LVVLHKLGLFGDFMDEIDVVKGGLWFRSEFFGFVFKANWNLLFFLLELVFVVWFMNGDIVGSVL